VTQYDNLGDLLINKCLVDELSKFGEVFIDSKNVPDEFIEKLLFETKNVRLMREITRFSFKGLGFIRLPFFRSPFTHLFKSPGPFGGTDTVKQWGVGIVFSLIFELMK